MNHQMKKCENIIALYEEACGKTYYSTKVLDCKEKDCDALYCTNNLTISRLFVEFCDNCDQLFCNFHIHKYGENFFCMPCFQEIKIDSEINLLH